MNFIYCRFSTFDKQNVYGCSVCGKEFDQDGKITMHIKKAHRKDKKQLGNLVITVEAALCDHFGPYSK